MTNDTECPLFSFAIIADTHITDEEGLAVDGSQKTGEKIAGMYRDLIERVNDMNPAFVVHLGDITHPTPTSPDYSEAALEFHKASKIFSMPYYLVPGNHDIGEKIHPALPKIDPDVSITKRAVGLYEQHFGRQRYSFVYEHCLFVVINTMLLNSGLEEEQEQWDWLELTLAENAGMRTFIFAHYPLYLSSKDEPNHYDNIDEPARSSLLELLKPYNVEGYYAGHVHNFFYNHLNGMHQFVLPSTSIIRHDYQQFFRVTPTREMGRFDPAKTGFFWVDVYPERHVPYLIRANNDHPYRVHSWTAPGATVTMDLRMPWCDEADISTPWAVEIFERKHVRNDYPLSALWEMGVRDLRIPISDILDARVSKRVAELASLGHRFTVVMFGAPDEERRAALEKHMASVTAIEVVALLSQWQGLPQPLTALRDASEFDIYLNAVRPEVEGWTTHHGMHTDLTDEVEWVLAQSGLTDAVDGFVFGLRPGTAPCDGFAEVRRCLAGTGYRPLLHVPCVGFDRTSAPTDEASRLHELSRTAEAAFLARAYPDISIVLDNFVELDRGYFNCRGLVDRFYNPKDGSRLVTALNRLLPTQLNDPESRDSDLGRVVSAECDRGTVMLILPHLHAEALGQQSDFAGDLADKAGTLINLTTGETSDVDCRSLTSKEIRESISRSPVLFILNN